MKKNIGGKDRIIRFLISVILFVLALHFQSWILLLFAIFTLYEAAASWCALYWLLGKDSCSIEKK